MGSFRHVVLPQLVEALQLVASHEPVLVGVALRVFQSEQSPDLGDTHHVNRQQFPFAVVSLCQVVLEGVGRGLVGQGGQGGQADSQNMYS